MLGGKQELRRELRWPLRLRLPPPSRGQALVNAGVVHEYDVISLQCRSEELFDIGFEHFTSHRTFEHEGRGNTIMSQRSDERNGLPVPMRDFLHEPLALRRSAIEACDRRRDAGFIDEHKPLRMESRLLLLQGLTCGGDVGPVLLGGAQTFF
jgi:hypothetical protein